MKHFLPVLTMMIVSISFAQIRFEPGFYVNNQNVKIDGLIRNMAWNQNPEAIEFKSGENAPITTIPMSDMSQFNVGDFTYRKFTVQVDQSSVDTQKLSETKNPEWQTATLLLRVVTEGNLTLYSFTKRNTQRFFFSAAPHDKPEQLIYKEFLLPDRTIGRNNAFRQQLSVAMQAKNFPNSTFEKIDYSKNDLAKLFIKYNGNEQNASEYQKKQTKGELNLKIIAGANFGNFAFRYKYFTTVDGDFGNSFTPSIGVEAEYILPFNKNKWSVFAAPNFQSYHPEDIEVTHGKATVKYKFIEIPVGVRHYFYVTNSMRISLHVGYAFAAQLSGSELVYPEQAADRNVPLIRSSSVLGGIGFGTKRFGLEFRYNAPRGLLRASNFSGDYSSYGFALHYRVL